NLLRMRMRNRFLQLISNRLRIRRAIPSVIHRTGHALRIPSGKRVFRLGESTHVYAVDGTGPAENFLRQSQRGHDLVVFASTGRKNSDDAHLTAGDRDFIAELTPESSRQVLAEQHITG